MDNAEEVMQLLEEFSKMKPKEIPRELDEYLGYVAKTGDPVYQWSLIKCLFREKLLNVITDFYESTPTIDLPPSPNVDPFNYERMKTTLLERLDSFNSAPFTVQRICELLTNPRKEYNRADKFMRAIEKNVLVVSTREPGPGRRVECDNQTDAVLNGIPETKLIDSQENIVNICSYHSPVADTLPVTSENDNPRVEQEEIEIDNTTEVISDSGKGWDKSVSEDVIPLNAEEVTLQYKTDTEELEKKDDLTNNGTSECNVVEESSESNINDNSESFSNTQNKNCDGASDNTVENRKEEEASSTCEEVVNFEISVVSIQPSEVRLDEEATESVATQNLNTKSSEDSSHGRSPDETESESKENEGITEVSIAEINNLNKLEDTDSEINIPTIEFPPPSGLLSPESENNNKNVLENDETSTDSNIGLFNEEKGLEKTDSINKEVSVAESAPEAVISDVDDSVASIVSEKEETVTASVSSPTDDIIKVEMNSEIVTETVSTEEVITSDDSASVKNNKINSALVESTNEVLHICEQDRREGSIIQSTPVNMATDTETVMEEINVDQAAEEETEAMDVDESSNQPMIVSEGENEGEPMDQCDQSQS